MNYLKLKRHFQKGVIILVTTMLLTIPNMRVYSLVGLYQTSSQAITSNNSNGNKRHFGVENKNWTVVGISIMGVLIVGVACVAGAVAAALIVHGDPPFICKNIDPNYIKYDFSQFDN